MSKNSLASIKNEAAPNASLPKNPPKPEVNEIKLGRKPKPEAEKSSKPITLKFTPAEFDKITKKAGLVNKATLLKQLLLTETSLFKK
jgi:hypothetical protein